MVNFSDDDVKRIMDRAGKQQTSDRIKSDKRPFTLDDLLRFADEIKVPRETVKAIVDNRLYLSPAGRFFNHVTSMSRRLKMGIGGLCIGLAVLATTNYFSAFQNIPNIPQKEAVRVVEKPQYFATLGSEQVSPDVFTEEGWRRMFGHYIFFEPSVKVDENCIKSTIENYKSITGAGATLYFRDAKLAYLLPYATVVNEWYGRIRQDLIGIVESCRK